MGARRGPLRNWAEFLAAEGVAGLVEALPEVFARRLLTGFAGFSWRLARRRRGIAVDRVQRALGLSQADARAQQIVRRSFDGLLLNVFEQAFVRGRLLRGERPEDIIAVDGAEHMRAALADQRGVLLCSGHLGAWELIPLIMATLFEPPWMLARELNNPRLQRALMARRLLYARGIIPKTGGGLKLARLLRAGESVVLLLDQNAGSHGEILPFMGMPSSHHNVAGVMAQRYGALAVPYYILREERGRRFRFIVEPAIAADPALPPDQAALDVTRSLSASLEAMVRQYPEQWLWLHDRWRHALHVSQPPTQVPVVQGTNGT